MERVEIKFFIEGKIPAGTHQMKKVTFVGGKPRFYESANLKAAREYYMARLKAHAPKKPITGAIRLVTYWCYKLPKGKKEGAWKTTRPDTDNLVKLFKDCMTACGFWEDDAQVVMEEIVKIYREKEGIWVKVEELED